MKPFTKEHIDALDEFINAKILYILHKREGGWSNDTLNSDFDRLEEATNNLHALLVNDSEPVVMSPYCKADLPAYDGKPVYTYNPETHMLVPRVWSEEEWSKITVEIFNHSSARTWPSKPIEDIHYAITKVFGGEK